MIVKFIVAGSILALRIYNPANAYRILKRISATLNIQLEKIKPVFLTGPECKFDHRQ
ncbi:hypothetical protein METHB2_240032 [Candidatus Methylobacter favarea]|uniref:Uncharacterized protein n=1 Tax=Candidatus Methylobacter favarea TaxID=2707345 RepID=A0A8S0WA83_9GAMM|nr:hypothetical protein METHB2_240032 [Candidatus Methylobacter favarea]